PAGADIEKMTPAEKTYAVKWTTIALCEAEASAAHDRRDARLRKLKADANISFRRFGGLTKEEKLNWRERDFMEYRKEQEARLAERHQRLVKDAASAEIAAARAELSDALARMGPAGLLRLAELSSCKAFGASEAFEAAAWSAASEAWRGAETSGVYAAADSADYDLPKIAVEKTKKLAGPDRRVAAIEKERLLRTDPKRLAALETRVSQYEERFAVERLQDFTLPLRRADAGLADAAGAAAAPSLTTALQFALESLGFVAFVNGPDNDYGPTTQGAVARLNAAKGRPATSSLSNVEARETICEAAAKNDPVSLYHVALMYKNGWGFPLDETKAAAAIARSETAMIAALGGDDLPDWKREAYKSYASKIRASAKELKKVSFAGDEALCK
ncbi:MAG: hypothetical protein HXY21_05840, partial [Parvularculaceae bacterium]|nr:hypothetical protein [Parvularculaceae bacterium]